MGSSSRLGRCLSAIAALALLLSGATPAAAAPPRGLIRDAEIEATLARIGRPLFQAAGLTPSMVRIVLVDDPAPNAFVAGGQTLFVNTGLLMQLKSLDEVRAVLAHETGHIAGGHVERRDAALGGTRGLALIGMVGAAAAAVAGSGGAAVGIATAGTQAARRTALAHTRTEEASADQAGLRLVVATGGDPQAMLDVLRRFQSRAALTGSGGTSYGSTHPLWRERIDMLEAGVAAAPPGHPPSAEEAEGYARMVAKLVGFQASQGEIARRYPDSDTSEPARLARAVADHRRPAPAAATAGAEALIALRPEDPYYHELLGQFLLESGHAAPAVAAYRDAVALAPKAPLLLGGLGRALLNLDDPAADAEAREVLRRSAALDRANPGVLRDLATAEARLGDEGAASLATAERFLLEGRFREAGRQATRAVDLLPRGSPGWKRAEDVIAVSRRAAAAGARKG